MITNSPNAVMGKQNPVPDEISTLLNEMIAEYEAVDAAYQVADAAILTQISSVQSGLSLSGTWSPSGGSFPSGSSAGDYYIADDSGTVNSVAFESGDWLISLVNSASTTTYASNWFQDRSNREIDRTQTFANRAAMIAADIPLGVNFIHCQTPDGRVISYVRDASGTAITSNSASVNWSPAKEIYADHFAENTTPGTTDMSSAIQSALAYADNLSTTDNSTAYLMENSDYAIGTRITLNEGYHLNMNGSQITLLSGIDRGFLVNGNNVILENGSCDCGYISQFLTATSFTNIIFRDITISDPKSRGFAFIDVSNSLIENVGIVFTASGATSHAAGSESFYGCLHTSTSTVLATQHVRVRNFVVDMSQLTAGQMQSLDSCLIIRGEETVGTNAVGIDVEDCDFRMPEGVLDTTYGSGLPRPTGMEVRQARDVRVRNVKTTGGDLTLSFGAVLNLSISDCVSRQQTHYCIELAIDSRDVAVSDCYFESTLSKSPGSLTAVRRAKLSNCTFAGGLDSTSAVCVVQYTSTDTKVMFSNCSFLPLNTGVDGVKLINGASTSINSCYFFSGQSGSAGHVHISSGTAPLVTISDSEFEGGATRPVKVTSVVDFLRVNNCDGIGVTLASDLAGGTVTASSLTGNNNLTNL